MEQNYRIKIDKKADAVPFFRVESNIPMPEKAKQTPKKRVSIYPFANMKVGDSFFVPKSFKPTNTVTGIAAYFSRKLKPKKFACRTSAEGTRVWRVS